MCSFLVRPSVLVAYRCRNSVSFLNRPFCFKLPLALGMPTTWLREKQRDVYSLAASSALVYRPDAGSLTRERGMNKTLKHGDTSSGPTVTTKHA